VVVADYVVHTPAGEVPATDIAEIDVGEHGQLMLLDDAGGLVAIFAAGQWNHARVATAAQED
jgi:hypothetical protein